MQRIVRTSERPDLIPTVAAWVWEAFWGRDGYTLEHVEGVYRSFTAEVGPQQAFVLLIDERPVGVASLVFGDLEERPDLSPWLAGVFVAPEARGRGHVAGLIRAVEDAARAGGVPILWLYTSSAERIYARAGWRTVEAIEHNGRPAVLMQRALAPTPPAPSASGAPA